jgi:putative ABC transport system permease protein
MQMAGFMKETGISLRMMARRPGFSIVAASTLGVGVGAAIAVFSVLNAVVLQPLPYEDADRMVRLETRVPGLGVEGAWQLSAAGFHYLRSENTAFRELGAASGREMNISGEGPPERAYTAIVTAGLMPVLGARAEIGRLISFEDDVPNGPDVAVLGHGFWARRFGGDPGVLGQPLRIEGRAVEIIGVMAPGIDLPDRPVDVWLPWRMDPLAPAMNAHFVPVLGRMAPGVTIERAQLEVDRLTEQFSAEFPEAYSAQWMEESGFSTRVIPLRTHVAGEATRLLWILMAAVGLVLLISCANVAHLFLVRTEARRREIAIRAALGATRGTLARQFLTEGVLIALGAGVLGVWLSWAGIRTLIAVAPAALPRLSEVGLHGASFTFALLVTVATGLLIGCVPIVRSKLRMSPGALGEGGSGVTEGRERRLTRHVLVVTQVALGLVLLMSAGLLLRSFNELRAVDPGFRDDGVLTFHLALPAVEYRTPEAAARFQQTLIDRLEEAPAISAAGAIHRLPVRDGAGCFAFFVEDQPLASNEIPPCIAARFTAPGFFRSLGVGLRYGREFEPNDNEERAGVVVLSRALADRLWPDENPVGKGVRLFGDRPPYFRVIGVAEHTRDDGLDQPPAETAYFPLLGMPGEPDWGPVRSFNVVVRTSLPEPLSLAGEVRRIVAGVDPEIPVAGLQEMNEVVRNSISRVSFMMILLALAAGIALVLGAVGLYAVISSVVSERRNEIRIRIALGANAVDVVGLIVRQSLWLAVAGVVIGLGVALSLTHVLRNFLHDVSPHDPVVLVVVPLVLLAVAVVASLLPALRATALDPAHALRNDQP